MSGLYAIPLIYVSVAKENRTNEQTKQKIHSHRKQMGGYQRARACGEDISVKGPLVRRQTGATLLWWPLCSVHEYGTVMLYT